MNEHPEVLGRPEGSRPVNRRSVLALAGGAGIAAVAGSLAVSARPAAAAATTTVPIEPATDVIPEETGGPFPGDGSNGVNVLAESGIVREDITSSVGTSTTVAEGVAMQIELLLTDISTGAAMPGAAVYVWHCDREGRYSLYSPGAEKENYLRGVQAADDAGRVTFVSIFPGCYSGRWPHVHFEIYPSIDHALGTTGILHTSQLALPADVCTVVYAESGYEQSVSNLAQLSLATDGVFRDDQAVHQIATVTGSVADGYVAVLGVGV